MLMISALNVIERIFFSSREENVYWLILFETEKLR